MTVEAIQPQDNTKKIATGAAIVGGAGGATATGVLLGLNKNVLKSEGKLGGLIADQFTKGDNKQSLKDGIKKQFGSVVEQLNAEGANPAAILKEHADTLGVDVSKIADDISADQVIKIAEKAGKKNLIKNSKDVLVGQLDEAGKKFVGEGAEKLNKSFKNFKIKYAAMAGAAVAAIAGIGLFIAGKVKANKASETNEAQAVE